MPFIPHAIFCVYSRCLLLSIIDKGSEIKWGRYLTASFNQCVFSSFQRRQSLDLSANKVSLFLFYCESFFTLCSKVRYIVHFMKTCCQISKFTSTIFANRRLFSLFITSQSHIIANLLFEAHPYRSQLLMKAWHYHFVVESEPFNVCLKAARHVHLDFSWFHFSTSRSPMNVWIRRVQSNKSTRWLDEPSQVKQVSSIDGRLLDFSSIEHHWPHHVSARSCEM